jgi:hypothetical protein
MKKIVLFIVLLIGYFTSFAQNDSTKYVHYTFQYGSWMDRYRADKVLMLPADTSYSKDGIARLNDKLFLGDGSLWHQVAPDVLATGNAFIVNSQAAMLALDTAKVGDIAIRSDSSKSFILQSLPSSTLSNWVQLLFPASVNSVFGRTGVITAQSGDYDAFYLSPADTVGRWVQNIYSRNDSLFQLKNGMETFIKSGLSQSTVDSILGGYYTRGQVDSITDATKSFFNGGTTGQTLVKNSNTDLDFSWSTPAGSTNSNTGSGYRLAVPFTNNIRTIFSVSPIGIDSVTNTNALTFTFDTSVFHTSAYNNATYGSLSQQNTNTSNIASNTTAIGNKADKATTLNINGSSQDLSTNRTWVIPVGDSVISFAKNATRDSIILTLKDGRRLAVKDSIGGGSGSIALKTNGTTNGSQSILNLKNGTNTTITDDGSGGITINSTGGGTSQLDWYYPENYGALRDSVTDDGPAFQAMINAMPLRGGKVHLSSGVYLINTPVVVDKSIMFEGNGMVNATNNRATSLITTSNIAMFTVVEANVKFRDLVINDMQSSTPVFGSVGIRADSNYVTINHVIVGLALQNIMVNGFYNNVEATGTSGFTFNNCQFKAANNYSVSVANRYVPDAGDSYITGCMFSPSSTGAVAAIYQRSSGGLRITNSKFNSATGKFNYFYLADSIYGTADLFIGGMTSLENWKVSAIKIKNLPTSSFTLVNINGNEFGDFGAATAPAIDINGISNINIVGNTFNKGVIDTAIKMTSVTSSVITGNTYSSGYTLPVYYAGTNSHIYGDGVALGTKNSLPKFTDSVHIGNSVYEDSSSVAAINLLKNVSGYVPNYINLGTGVGKLSIATNTLGGSLDVAFINSNIAAATTAFTFWKQTGATASDNLLTIKTNGKVGFGGITSPTAYVDIPAGTGAGNTGQIHLAPGVKSSADGYLSYDTTIGGRHLYFNINGTQQRLDSQVTTGGGTPILADGTVPLSANWNVGSHNISGVTTLTATTVSASSVTGNTVSSNGGVNGTNLLATQFSVGTGTPTGLQLKNGQPATSIATVQNSLMALWTGAVWDGSTSQTVNYRAGIFPIGGTNTSEWKLSTNLNAGSYTDVLKVKSDGRVTLSNVINLKAYTVATLPTGTVGDQAYVTDATSPTYLGTLTGGGTVTCPVFFNGTAWVSH